ncbi:MAG: peptide chain release factor N(5)-glutamine methyltransferase [Planctomycetaceae bacterium]|nr:peptide chain release factor N(5)-glutamine methyltransferase [Planctomycetaceae bacterium]
MSQSASSETWTVQRILEWTTAHLKKHGSDTPRLDAEILLAHARHCRRLDLYTRFDDVLTEDERTTMRDLVQRRAKHEPVAYLVGRREFYGLPFRVTSDVLIPRPDTETLVMELLEALKPTTEPRLLDIGTGSGCIAITAAKQRPDARVTAIDRSEAALAVARDNAETLGVSDRVEFLHGDLFAPLRASGSNAASFDAVASTPPYIREDEFDGLQPDVRLHEPRIALVAGGDGLDVARRLIAESPEFLKPGGRLMLEIAPEQAEAVRTLLETQGSFDEVRLIKDLNRDLRVASARKRP